MPDSWSGYAGQSNGLMQSALRAVQEYGTAAAPVTFDEFKAQRGYDNLPADQRILAYDEFVSEQLPKYAPADSAPEYLDQMRAAFEKANPRPTDPGVIGSVIEGFQEGMEIRGIGQEAIEAATIDPGSEADIARELADLTTPDKEKREFDRDLARYSRRFDNANGFGEKVVAGIHLARTLFSKEGAKLLGESAAGMPDSVIGALGGGAAGTAVGGPIGGIAGGIAGLFGGSLTGSTTQEVGQRLRQAVVAAGVDPQNEKAVVGFLRKNPAALQDAVKKGAGKGLALAGIDTVLTLASAGAYKVIQPASRVGRVAKEASRIPVAGASEAASEAGASFAIGETASGSELLIEGLMGAGPQAIETGIAGLGIGRGLSDQEDAADGGVGGESGRTPTNDQGAKNEQGTGDQAGSGDAAGSEPDDEPAGSFDPDPLTDGAGRAVTNLDFADEPESSIFVPTDGDIEAALDALETEFDIEADPEAAIQRIIAGAERNEPTNGRVDALRGGPAQSDTTDGGPADNGGAGQADVAALFRPPAAPESTDTGEDAQLPDLEPDDPVDVLSDPGDEPAPIPPAQDYAGTGAKPEATLHSKFLLDIARGGGLVNGLRADVGAIENNPVVPGNGRLFRKTGMEVDELVELLHEQGYITQAQIDDPADNGAANLALEMVERALMGEQVFRLDDDAALEQQAREEAEGQAMGVLSDLIESFGEDPSGLSLDEMEAYLSEHEDALVQRALAEAAQDARDDELAAKYGFPAFTPLDDKVAFAAEIDPDAVERASEIEDDAEFERRIDRIIYRYQDAQESAQGDGSNGADQDTDLAGVPRRAAEQEAGEAGLSDEQLEAESRVSGSDFHVSEELRRYYEFADRPLSKREHELLADNKAGDFLESISPSSRYRTSDGIPKLTHLVVGMLLQHAKTFRGLRFHFGNAEAREALARSRASLGDEGGTGSVNGLYRSRTNEIFFPDSSPDLSTVLHEMGHAATVRQFDRPSTVMQKRAAKRIRKIYKHVRKVAERDGVADQYYGLKNEHEFIAEAMSNARFQNYLRTVEIESEALVDFESRNVPIADHDDFDIFTPLNEPVVSSAWEWFKAQVAGLLGFGNAATETLIAIEALIAFEEKPGERTESFLSRILPSQVRGDDRVFPAVEPESDPEYSQDDDPIQIAQRFRAGRQTRRDADPRRTENFLTPSEVSNFARTISTPPRTTGDVLKQLPRSPAGAVRSLMTIFGDNMVEWFADQLLPAVRWIEALPVSEQTQRFLIGSIRRVPGVRGALAEEADKKFGRPMREALAKLARKHGKTTDEMMAAVGWWMTANYAPQQNQYLLEKDLREIRAVEELREAVRIAGGNLDAVDSQLEKLRRRYDTRLAEVNGPADRERFNQGVSAGFTNARAAQIKKDIEAQIPESEIREVARHVWDALQWKLDLDLKSGKLSDEIIADWPRHPEYVPTTGDPRDVDYDDITSAVHGVNPNQRREREVGGRLSSTSSDGITSAWDSIGRSTQFAAWQDAKRTLNQIWEQTVADLKAEGRDDRQAAESAARRLNMRRVASEENQLTTSNTIVYREAGQQTYQFQIMDNRALEAIKKENVDQRNRFLEVLGKPTRVYAQMVTLPMPAFAPVNSVRDLGERSEFLRTRRIFNADGNLIDSNKAARRMIGLMYSPGNMKASFRKGFKNPDLTTQTGRDIEELISLGGLSTWGKYLDDRRVGIADAIRSEARRQKFPGGKKLEAIGEVIQGYNAGFDMLASVAVFQALKEQGVDPKTAAQETLDLMNFRKSGAASPFLRALFVFANPAIQGGYNFGRLLKTGRGRVRFAAYLVFGMFLYALLRETYDEDEAGNRLDTLGDWTTERSVPIKIGESIFKLPIGFGMPQYAWAVAQHSIRLMVGESSAGEYATQILKASTKTVSPVQPAEFDLTKYPVVFMAQMLSPTLLRPMTYLATDRNAFGQRISPVYPQTSKLKAEQPKFSTPEFYQEVAVWMQRNLGFDVYPESIRTVLNGYMVGPLRHAVLLPLIDNPNRERLGRKKIPAFINTMVGVENEFATIVRARSAYDELQQLAAEKKSREERGEDVKAWERAGNRKRLLNLYERWKKQDNKLRGQKRRVTNRFKKGRLNESRRDKEYDLIYSRRDGVNKRFLNEYRRILGRPTRITDAPL